MMMAMRRFGILVPLCALFLSNCGYGGLVGDWFRCEDKSCSELDDEGLRFGPNERWALLDAPGNGLEEGEVYFLSEVGGDYLLDGETLTIFEDGQDEPTIATVTFEAGGMLLIRVSSIVEVCQSAAAVQPPPADMPPPERRPPEVVPSGGCQLVEQIEENRFKRVGEGEEVGGSSS